MHLDVTIDSAIELVDGVKAGDVSGCGIGSACMHDVGAESSSMCHTIFCDMLKDVYMYTCIQSPKPHKGQMSQAPAKMSQLQHLYNICTRC